MPARRNAGFAPSWIENAVGLVEAQQPDIDRGELLVRRDNVQDREPGHALGMIEGQAIRDAPAAVVAGDRESLEPQRGHDLDEIAGHAPLGIPGVIVAGRRAAARSVAA